MATTTRTLYLDEVTEYMDLEEQEWKECPALAPDAKIEAPIVNALNWAEVADGHHRLAGYVNWARENGLGLHEVQVPVVVTTDRDLFYAAGALGDEQRAALDTLYSAAA